MRPSSYFLPLLVLCSGMLLVAPGPRLLAAEEPQGAIAIAEVKHDGPVDFEQEILPIFRRKCLACHNASEAEGEMVLETPQAISKGGSTGPAIVPGKGRDSLLLKVASRQQEEYMPPDDNDVGAKPLTPDELGLIKLWIDEGAKGEVRSALGPVKWQPLPPGVNPIYAAAISTHGDLVAAGRANQVFVYHVQGKQLLSRLTDPALMEQGRYQGPGVAHLDLVQSLAFSPDGQWLASGGYRTVKLWRRAASQRKVELKGAESKVTSMASAKDGKRAAIGEENGRIRLFELPSGNLVRTLEGHTAPVTGLSFSADGGRLVSGSHDKTVRVWNAADGKELNNFETPAAIHAVALVAGDSLIATGHADNAIHTWAVPGAKSDAGDQTEAGGQDESATPLKTLRGHSGAITSLVVSPANPAQLASGSQDGTVRTWDAAGGNQTRQFSHGGPVEAVAISPDGKRLVSASSNHTAKLWNAENGQQIAEMKGDFRADQRVALLNRSVALGDRRVANAKKDVGEAKKRQSDEEGNVKKTEAAHTAAEAALKQKDEAVKKPTEDKQKADQAFETAQQELTTAEEGKQKADEEAAKSAGALNQAEEDLKNAQDDDAKSTATKARDEAVEKNKQAQDAKRKAEEQFRQAEAKRKQAEDAVKRADAPYQKSVGERDAAQQTVEAAVRSIERAKLSVQTATEAVPVVEAALKQEQQQVAKYKEEVAAAQQQVAAAVKPVMSVAFSPDGSTLVTAGVDRLIHVWSGTSGAAIDVISGPSATVTALAYTPDRTLISVAEDRSVVVWHAPGPRWELTRTIGSAESSEFVDRVTALHFSPDGTMLATGGGEPSRSGELKLWNVDDGQLIREVSEAHSDTVLGLEFSPDGKHIASSAADRFMKVFEVASGSLVKSFEGHTHHVLGVSWQADGRVLATGGADKVVKLWKFPDGDQIRTIQGFGKEVTAVSFAGVADRFVAGSGDKSVSMCTTAGGRNGMGNANDFIYVVRSSCDGKQIVSGGQDSIVRVVQDNGQMIAQFEPPQPATE